MINVGNLVFRYNPRSPDVVKNISFKIDRGEVFGFLGPSGAGKSTAQKIITGQLKDYSGSVKIEGEEIKTAARTIYNRIGVAFEFPNLYEKLTAAENLRLFGSFYNREIIDPETLLGMVNLYDDRNTLAGSFSKGMKMRLNFARSIMHRPELLFLDEPTSGLDPVNAKMIKDIILKLKSKGTTIFLTTHNMHDADSLCDRLALIDNGVLIISGTPADLKQQYGERSVKVTLNNLNGRSVKEFGLSNIGSNKQFLDALNSSELETIHTCEASLEDIFCKVTGHTLTGVQHDLSKNKFKLLKYDLNIQMRSGYWTVYGVIALVYILIMVNLPLNIRDEVAVGLIYMDTSVLGLIFVGALVLLEKQQGVLHSLSVTPLSLNKYLFSKAISLTLLSAVISSLLWIIPLWSFSGYGFILSGVILSSIAFTLFGLGFAAGASTFNQFLARIFIGAMVFSLPVLPMVFLPSAGWLIFLPSNAALDLFIRVTKDNFSVLQLLDILILIIWIFILRIFAEKQFLRHNLFL